jgi:tripartite ATP-independent transporter DctP family solute receptor
MKLLSRSLLATALAAAWIAPVAAAERHFTFAYDQPTRSAFSAAADIFAARLAALSGGTMVIDQYPGGQLGQETQLLQKVRTGDVDFTVTSTANAATLSPQAGVLSLHYVFRSEAHIGHAVADKACVGAVRGLFDTTVQGTHAIAVLALGLRNVYGKKEIHNVADMRGLKIRVQATPTEDAIFPAYGAQTTHMDLGNVYTSLQTGVIDMSENVISVYRAFKHYETAPVMSLTEHEANLSILWVSDKVLNSLTDQQKKWVQQAADDTAREQPQKAFDLEHESVTALTRLGVKFVRDVDKAGFIAIAEPVQDKQAAELGPQAVSILKICRAAQ